ncbi:MAG: alpha/beta fold hydrolase [Geodermatophilaceae bacterium]
MATARRRHRRVGVGDDLGGLVGHGGSRAIGTRFTLPDQAAALGVLFDGHGWEQVVLVGRGWGAAVAADFARRHPDRVSRLILLDPPVYTDAGEAGRRLRSSRLGRATLTSPGLANFGCGLMCLTRAPLGRLARVGRGGVCGAEAAAAVQHTYPSLRDGFDALVNANPLLSVLRDPVHPVTVAFAAGAAVPAGDLHALPISADVNVVAVSGTTDLLAGHTDVVARLVAERSRN